MCCATVKFMELLNGIPQANSEEVTISSVFFTPKSAWPMRHKNMKQSIGVGNQEIDSAILSSRRILPVYPASRQPMDYRIRDTQLLLGRAYRRLVHGERADGTVCSCKGLRFQSFRIHLISALITFTIRLILSFARELYTLLPSLLDLSIPYHFSLVRC